MPALDDNGVYIPESREISRYLCNKFLTDPKEDHWYPKDPVKRQEVDLLLDWSKPLHESVGAGIIVAKVFPLIGAPWRDTYGIFGFILGKTSNIIHFCFLNIDLKNLILILSRRCNSRSSSGIEKAC